MRYDEGSEWSTGGRAIERSAVDTPASTSRPSNFFEPGSEVRDELEEREAAADAANDPWAPRPDSEPSRLPTEEEWNEAWQEIGEDIIEVLRDIDEAVPGLLTDPRPLVSEAEYEAEAEYVSELEVQSELDPWAPDEV